MKRILFPCVMLAASVAMFVGCSKNDVAALHKATALQQDSIQKNRHMTFHSLRYVAFVLLFFSLGTVGLRAQGADPNLANQYFSDGEFEKAATLYGQLVEKERRSDYYFTRYIDCLTKLEKWEDAEKAGRPVPDQPGTMVAAYRRQTKNL